MSSFEYNGTPIRVVFGAGTRNKLPSELTRLNVTRPIILSTPEQISQAEEIRTLAPAAVGIFSEATMHTPTHITEKALSTIKSLNADGIVSIGGGSTTGLGKAISIRTGLVHVSIPTTYAGSEMTPILGETENGVKTTRRDKGILPTTVIYDVELTLSLPVGLSGTSGVNAIAHAVEALYAPDTNPLIRLYALDGVRSLSSALPLLVNSPRDLSARTTALYGAWLCALCLGATTMSLHHKLCHVLGGSLNLPHAETHTIILPHALAYNAPAIPEVMKDLAGCIEGSEGGDAVKGLNSLLEKLGVKRSLKEIGMEREEDIEKAVGIAMKNPYWNPRKVEEGGIREIIGRAWRGEEARGV